MKKKLLVGVAGLLLASSSMFAGWRVGFGFRGGYYAPRYGAYVGVAPGYYYAPAPYAYSYAAPAPYVAAAPFYGAVWFPGRWGYGPRGRYWVRGYWGHRR
ncbi:MAG: hypothetical protein JO145_02105 [Acidobacteriaceae bacterium]|nr:hypothetical protein [Acidobacteriaceae bacterium]MBV9764800.1 hypothetical protein [Acidobacteriaceae bacterium]